MNSVLHSVAGCSSFFFHYPSRVLFDCGEGVSEALKNYIFGVEKIVITHAHWDHIGGLPGFIFSRKKNRGSNEKPLEIYYPVSMTDKISFIRSFVGNNTIPIKWIGINIGDKISINNNWYIETFRTYHSRDITLGYAIREDRRRLKIEYRTNAKELHASGFKFTEDHYESYTHTILAWLLDSYKIDNEQILNNANTVIFDGTFIKDEDRDDGFKSHMSWSEIYNFAEKYNIKHSIIAHISPRYMHTDITKAIQKIDTQVSTRVSVVTNNATFAAEKL